jgi:hypothetical protein
MANPFCLNSSGMGSADTLATQPASAMERKSVFAFINGVPE